MLGYLAFTIMQMPVVDARSLVTIFIVRFLQGFFGAAPSSILSGVLADIWSPKQRGFAMPTVGCFLTIGPIFGPLVGAGRPLCSYQDADDNRSVLRSCTVRLAGDGT